MKVANIKLAGVTREQDRKDAVQTAIIQLCNGLMGVKMDGTESNAKSFDKIETVEHLRNMFYRILRARITDLLRKTKPDGDGKEPVASSTGDRSIWELVDRLNPPKPELIVARFLYGFSTDEIARDYKMSRNTVCSHINRGMKSLRTWMEEDR